MFAKRGGRESSMRALAEARLDHLEVEEAREAEAPAEGEADQQLRAEQAGEPFRSRDERDQRERSR